jgi:hypothetical protein
MVVRQLYLFAGLTHQGYINVESTYNETTGYTYTQGPFGYVFGGGIGIGIEVILFEHFSVPFEIGYGVYWDGSKETLAEQFLVDLALQVGFRYRYEAEVSLRIRIFFGGRSEIPLFMVYIEYGVRGGSGDRRT